MCPKVCIFLGKNAYSNLRTLGFSRLWMTVSLATTEVCVFRALASVGALLILPTKRSAEKVHRRKNVCYVKTGSAYTGMTAGAD